MDDEEVKDLARKIAKSTSSERIILITDLYKTSTERKDFLAPVRVGIELRNGWMIDLAEQVLLFATYRDEGKDSALYELALCKFLKGQLNQAKQLINEIKKIKKLRLDQAIREAIIEARLGNFSSAKTLMSKVISDNSHFINSGLAWLQMFDFLADYPYEKAKSLLAEVEKKYRKLEALEIEEQVIQALKEKRPYMLLRLGDGEGANTRISWVDEATYPILYNENRKEFHSTWFGRTDFINSVEFSDFLNCFDDALLNADCISGYENNLLNHEYSIGSRRGIPSVVNLIRKADQIYPIVKGKCCITHSVIHYALLFSNCLERILKDRKFLGIVTCHTNLPEKLQEKYRIGEVESYFIPKEMGRSSILGDKAKRGTHFPDAYQSLSEKLKSIRPGELYLVAGGILGKVYCNIIKQAGGVVIDIGTVADIWMGKVTRDVDSSIINRIPEYTL